MISLTYGYNGGDGETDRTVPRSVPTHYAYPQLLTRLQQFTQDDFDREYTRFQCAQQRLRVLYRFRHHPRRCLAALEQEWADAIHHKHGNH